MNEAQSAHHMRYAVISDIHSNLEALCAVLERIDGLAVDKVVCLGDIVGYNANPNECIEIIRERKIVSAMGNHDATVAGLHDTQGFNHLAASAIDWTRMVLTDDNREFLKTLAQGLPIDKRFLCVHGWLNNYFRYITGAQDAKENFDLLEKDGNLKLCFFGHTHVAISYIENEGSVLINMDSAFTQPKDAVMLVNPGSVGQPRDADPRASFVIYDSVAQSITFHRADYDIQTTARKIIEAGLPERLAERLKLGW
ncbi:MAG: metallophosphoesterase family protein [Deltaproteobacteria bacterium]|nr:metallophosphoesterase family protein [Deltaproteobacteria bacterium]